MMYMKNDDWRNHILEGSSQGVDEAKTAAIIKAWLEAYATEAVTTIKVIQKTMESNAVVKAHHQKTEALLRRWEQIKDICESAFKAISV